MNIKDIDSFGIEQKIYLIRGRKVMLDSDLASLYGVETKNLNKAVKRNQPRFSEDFMFQLTENEALFLRFQFGTSKKGSGGRRYYPCPSSEVTICDLKKSRREQERSAQNIGKREIKREFYASTSF